jgi:hypothetical protein
MSEIDRKNMFHPPNHQLLSTRCKEPLSQTFQKIPKEEEIVTKYANKNELLNSEARRNLMEISVNQTQDFLCPVKGEYLITRSCFFKFALLKISACQIVQCEAYTVEDKKTTTVTTIPLN